jgi:hypothetical protein
MLGQVVEHLPSKCGALSQTPVPPKTQPINLNKYISFSGLNRGVQETEVSSERSMSRVLSKCVWWGWVLCWVLGYKTPSPS